jgi:hypothetical protein
VRILCLLSYMVFRFFGLFLVEIPGSDGGFGVVIR